MTSVQHVEVAADDADQRLDRWLRKRWPHVGQGRIEKMCRKGEIRVDGVRAKASTRVSPGQVVRVPPLPVPVPGHAEQSHVKAPAADLVRRVVESVIYRDDELIVLNKPAGLSVQGGSKQDQHLGSTFSSLRFGRRDDPRLVHRLDRDTSGLLVLARTGRAATELGQVFRSRQVQKTYVAAVAGKPEPGAGTIRFGLVKAGGRGAERMEVVHPDEISRHPGAKRAVTDYRVIAQAGTRVAAVALRPITGRTHQLRAHMAALGTPIAGDGKYGGRHQENQGDGWGAGLGGGLSRKLHLHAVQLAFRHPTTGRPLVFFAPLPDHMQRTWDLLHWDQAQLQRDLFDPDQDFTGR